MTGLLASRLKVFFSKSFEILRIIVDFSRTEYIVYSEYVKQTSFITLVMDHDLLSLCMCLENVISFQ